jgi:hypothetical protein
LHKRYGDAAEIAKGQLAYASPKADSDAAIEGLITALTLGELPDGLPFVQKKLTSSVAGLADFAKWVNEIVSSRVPKGQKGIGDAILKLLGTHTFLKAILDGVAVLYNNHRNDNALNKRLIATQLEGTRWPDFARVKPTQ